MQAMKYVLPHKGTPFRDPPHQYPFQPFRDCTDCTITQTLSTCMFLRKLREILATKDWAWREQQMHQIWPRFDTCLPIQLLHETMCTFARRVSDIRWKLAFALPSRLCDNVTGSAMASNERLCGVLCTLTPNQTYSNIVLTSGPWNAMYAWLDWGTTAPLRH